MSNYLFKDRDGQTPLPPELRKGLKSKFIQNMGELDQLEEKNITRGLNWLLSQKSDPTKYQFWIKLHKKLFEQVWSWAGEVRTHELENPDFKLPHDIWPEIRRLELDLENWISLNSFPMNEISAKFHERIETIHPFANGNGRFGRIITEQICKYHNHKIPSWGQNWSSDSTKRRKEYIDALVLARREKKYSHLITFMFS